MLARFFCTNMIVLILALPSANAEESRDNEDHTTPNRKIDLSWSEPDKTPSEELLEFLGEWETPQGDWIDPQGIAQIEIPEPSNETISK